MRGLRAAFLLELRLLLTDPTHLMPLLTVPMFAIVFLAIVRQAGRGDLVSSALLAPVLMALWQLSLFVSGEIVAEERWLGTVEPALATPARFPGLVFARVLAVTVVSLVAAPEVLLVGRVVFGAGIHVYHPVPLVLALLATAFAVSGTALVMAALFVLTRSARTFQNSLSYPFYVLGGVFVPVSVLPAWIRPVSSVVFLSWSADLLRASLRPAAVHDVALRLAAICGLGLVGLAVGLLVLGRTLRRLQQDGTLGVA